MQQATIVAKYVNPPKGRGPASIKDEGGRYWKFWTRDIPMEKFRPGQSYSIGYENEPYNGQDQFYIKAATEVINGHSAQPTNKPAPEVQRKTAPVDAERMFVCSILNACIQAGEVKLLETDLIQSVVSLRNVWQMTFGKDQ